MKKFFLIVAALALITGIKAQSAPKSDLELIQSIFGEEKSKLIELYMDLPDDLSTKFWSVYETYEMERRALVKERLDNLMVYINNYETLTNDQASDIGKTALKESKKAVKLHKKYFKKFKKAVGGLYALKFMQMETYIQDIIYSDVMDNLPFIGELDDLKQ